ncbi:MAG: T9SS type A sorting domain-containing protein [Bacteroidota bacterium]
MQKIDKIISVSQDEIKEILRQDSIENIAGLPFRFGKNLNVDIDLIKESALSQKGDTSIYKYEIVSPFAYSVNLIFDQFELNSNSVLTIYNNDGNYIYGPITAKENPLNGIFWTDLIKGDHIVIELSETNKNSNKPNQLHISSVVHGYKNVFASPNLFGESLGCENDIACPEGDDWRVEGNAVVMLLVDDANRFCSGSLINNTANNFRGFLLTAFHCLDWNTNCSLSDGEKSAVNNWLFRFHYESPSCDGIEGTDYITVNGATFRAGYQPTDFALLELLTTPTLATYAGWSKTTSISQGVGIHHPQGDVKKISFDFHSLSSYGSTSTWPGNCSSPSNTHWVVGYDDGTTEGGSSGSPIFDNYHRIVGQLHGGSDGCAPIVRYYGRFDKSWTGGLANDTRLKNWLDPLNSGVSFLNTNYSISSTLSGSTTVCSSSAEYTVNYVPANCSIFWKNSSTVSRISPQGSNPCTFSTLVPGPFWIRASIKTNSNNGYVTLPQYKGWVGTPQISNQRVDGNTYYPGYQICPGSHYLSVTPLGGGTATWTVPSGIINLVGTNQLDFTFPSSLSSTSISCRSSNSCGTGSNYYFYLTKKTYGCSGFYGMTLYPNPASDNVTIAMIEESPLIDTGDSTLTNGAINNAISKEPVTFTISIYNSQSTLLSTVSRSGKSFSIPLTNMRDGTYIIEVSDDKNSYRQQLIVKHN